MAKYKLSDFDYDLPEELIATEPASPRDSSRLLVLDKKTGEMEHRHFSDIVDYLDEGDVLVLNDSKVIPARLMAKKESTGGKVEVLLHKKVSAGEWECLLGGRVHDGLSLSIGRGLSAEVLKNNNDGTWLVKFSLSGTKLLKAVEKVGQMPLPPYIVAQIKDKKEKRKDKESYQTVFADDKKAGSVAAPTAGLHFTPRLLDKLKKKGVKILKITLYVGMGTFAPVKTEDISKHKMHAEWVEVGKSAIGNLQSAISEKRRVIAVGTTSCRSLEACWQKMGRPFDRLRAILPGLGGHLHHPWLQVQSRRRPDHQLPSAQIDFDDAGLGLSREEEHR